MTDDAPGRCDGCTYWTTKRLTKYGDGTVKENWTAPENRGQCESLGILTANDFGCNRFRPMFGHHELVALKRGEPWEHWHMGPCPDCRGNGSHPVELRPACNRCAGTGNVRYYDDGFVGDERTRRHPKEAAEAPKCGGCSRTVERNWKHCPDCGFRLYYEEKVSDAGRGESFEPSWAPPSVDPDVQMKIASLRNMTVERGCTPAEAAVAKQKADELEIFLYGHVKGPTEQTPHVDGSST